MAAKRATLTDYGVAQLHKGQAALPAQRKLMRQVPLWEGELRVMVERLGKGFAVTGPPKDRPWIRTVTGPTGCVEVSAFEQGDWGAELNKLLLTRHG